MKIRKGLIFFIAAASLALLLLLSCSAAGRDGECYVGDALYSKIAAKEDGTLTLPAAPAPTEGVFAGWILEDAGWESLYPAGAAVTPEPGAGSAVFRAFFLNLETLQGAATSLSGGYKLRFDGSLSFADYEKLGALVGQNGFSFGLITAPYYEITRGGANFDLEAGAAFVSKHPAAGASYTNATHFLFSAAVADIPSSALLEKYAARAYLTIRYANGAERTVYAAYRNQDHARSVHAVLAAAYEDRAAVQDGRYGNAAASKAGVFYSPYTLEELAFLQAGLNRVVSVQTPAAPGEVTRVDQVYSMDGIVFLDFLHYVSPYTVARVEEDGKVMKILVVAVDGADFSAISTYYIGHSYSRFLLNKCEMTAEGFVITHNIDTSIY